eukprot:6646901-Prymnesium_polylepis.1
MLRNSPLGHYGTQATLSSADEGEGVQRRPSSQLSAAHLRPPPRLLAPSAAPVSLSRLAGCRVLWPFFAVWPRVPTQFGDPAPELAPH